MARRHVYAGMYTGHSTRAATQHHRAPPVRDLRFYTSQISRYIWAGYNMMNGNYLALATVFAVVLLSFLIPDISQKIHKTSELKNMKKVLNIMTKEVDRAEVACLTAADEICYLQCTMEDGVTETPRYFQNLSIGSRHYLRPTLSEPMQMEKRISFFRRVFCPGRNTSHKEIAIMSYVYTDSFDAQKTLNFNDGYNNIMSTGSSSTMASDEEFRLSNSNLSGV